MADVLVRNEGTIFLIRPVSDGAAEWIDVNVDPEATWFGGNLVVEHRFAFPILEALADAGMTFGDL